MAKVLKIEKIEFDVGHGRLLEDLENLEKAHKALESKYSSFLKSNEQLQTQLIIEQSKCPDMRILEVQVPCATNSCCDKLREENAKLKEQLEKGLLTCVQGEKNLNELLNGQRDNADKRGLGFVPETHKKKKNKS